MKDIGATLELYRASQIIIHQEELILENQNLWTSHLLKRELSNGSIMADKLNKYIGQEVVFYNKLLFSPMTSHSCSKGRLLKIFVLPLNSGK